MKIPSLVKSGGIKMADATSSVASKISSSAVRAGKSAYDDAKNYVRGDFMSDVFAQTSMGKNGTIGRKKFDDWDNKRRGSPNSSQNSTAAADRSMSGNKQASAAAAAAIATDKQTQALGDASQLQSKILDIQGKIADDIGVIRTKIENGTLQVHDKAAKGGSLLDQLSDRFLNKRSPRGPSKGGSTSYRTPTGPASPKPIGTKGADLLRTTGRGLGNAAGSISGEGAGSKMGSMAARGGSMIARMALPAAGIAGAGYAGYQAGGLLNDHVLNPLAEKITGDKGSTVGTAIYDGVDKVSSLWGGDDATKQKKADELAKKRWDESRKNTTPTRISPESTESTAAQADLNRNVVKFTKSVADSSTVLNNTATRSIETTEALTEEKNGFFDKFTKMFEDGDIGKNMSAMKDQVLSTFGNRQAKENIEQRKKNTQTVQTTTKEQVDELKAKAATGDKDAIAKLESYKKAMGNQSTGTDKTAEAVAGTVQILKEDIQQKGLAKTVTENIGRTGKMAYDGIGSLSAKYESGKKGSNAIGWDSTGGTSYGKYQIASKAGKDGKSTMDSFMEYAKDKNPEVYDQLKAAGPADGGKNGAFADTWKNLAKDGKMGSLEHDFIKKSHYDVGMKGVKDDNLKGMIEKNPALQDVMWSTSVQHGGGSAKKGSGAAGIFNKVYKEGMTEQELIKAVYAERGTKFGSSKDNVKASVKNRFVDEEKNALAMLDSDKNKGSNKGQIPTQIAQTKPNIQPTLVASANSTPTRIDQPNIAQGELLSKSDSMVLAQATPLEQSTKLETASVAAESATAAKNAPAAPIVIASSGGKSHSSGTNGRQNDAGHAPPMVARNPDSSVRKVTDGLMSYGYS